MNTIDQIYDSFDRLVGVHHTGGYKVNTRELHSRASAPQVGSRTWTLKWGNGERTDLDTPGPASSTCFEHDLLLRIRETRDVTGPRTLALVRDPGQRRRHRRWDLHVLFGDGQILEATPCPCSPFQLLRLGMEVT